MIRKLVEQTFDSTKKYLKMAGLSTDSKPTSGLITGSRFYEVDTGGEYAFDEVSAAWTLVGMTSQAVKDEIDAWLEENIDPDSGYALDRTLSLSGAAAPADLVGDINDALKMVVTSSIPLESGTFSDANGTTKVSNNARIRTASPLDVGYFDTIIIAEGYQAYVFLLDSSLQKISTVTWSNKITKAVLSTASYINIAIRKTSATTADISGDVNTVISGTQLYIKMDAGIPDMEAAITALETDMDAVQDCFEDVPNNNRIIYNTITTETTQAGSRVVYADIYLEQNKSYVFRFWYNGGWYVFGSTKCTIESNGSVVETLFSYDSIPNTGLAFTWTEDSGVYKIHTLSGQAIGWTAQTIADGLMVYNSDLTDPVYVQGELITMAKDAERVGTMTASQIIAAAKASNADYSLIAYGDSLTQGAGSSGIGYRYLDICKTALEAKNDLPLGYGGSTSKAIAFTAGAISAYIPPNLTTFSLKYADLTSDVSIALNQLNNKTVIIGGEEYTISQTDSTEYSLPETYTPSDMYLPVVVKSSRYIADIYVIWVGTNDHDYKWDIIDAMISKLPHKQYIVMGLTRLGTDTTVENELKAYEKYGSHFFNTRIQIINNAFPVLDATPDPDDETAMAAGLMPPSLMSDDTHFNNDGYEAIGKLLAIHIKSLGYKYK